MSVNDIKDTTHRCADVAGESCVMLTLIEGFSKKPLVTLEEAIVPLDNIVPRISTYVYITKQRAVNPANDLSPDESASIALYTMEWEPYTDSLYYILNQTLRTQDRDELKPWFLYLKLLLTALSRIPSISLTVYRGLRSEIEDQDTKYRTGKELVWWGFSTCSKTRNISEGDHSTGESGQKTLFILDCINGKDISKHSYFKKEQEVLLLPATKVKVVSNTYVRHDSRVIHLEEIEIPFILLEPVSSPEEITTLRNQSSWNKTIPPPKAPFIEPERPLTLKLVEYIARCKPRSEIYLIGKHFDLNEMQVIVKKLIIDKQCRGFFLRESGVTSQGAFIIAEGLRNNNTLEHLFLSHNIINDEGAIAIAQSLVGNNNVILKQLCLGYNRITDDGVEYIADMLETNKTLTHLWLSSNEITDHGLKRLAGVLTNANKTLQVLELDWNKFRDDSSVNVLIDMLNNNQSLTKLSLKGYKLSKLATKQLRIVAKSKRNFELTVH